jgi:hypothetical protein
MIVQFSYVMFAGLALLGMLILFGCWVLLRLKNVRGFWVYFMFGLGLEVLLSLPAGIWQSVTGWGYLSFTTKGKMVVPLAGWFFNAAGYSVRSCILSVDSWWGNRPVVYFVMAVIQITVFAVLFAIRYKRRQSIRDAVVIVLVVLFLANSLANVAWEWMPPS